MNKDNKSILVMIIQACVGIVIGSIVIGIAGLMLAVTVKLLMVLWAWIII